MNPPGFKIQITPGVCRISALHPRTNSMENIKFRVIPISLELESKSDPFIKEADI